MKTLIIVMLAVVITDIANAQKVSLLFRDGHEKDNLEITASSSTQLFTRKGTFDLSDIQAIFFDASNGDTMLNERLKARGIAIYFAGVLFAAGSDTPPAELVPKSYSTMNDLYVNGLPIDEAGKMVFTDVIQHKGTAKELYFNAKRFFVDTFKSANDVVQLDDAEKFTIIGKGFSKIFVATGFGGQKTETRLFYTLKVVCKDQRFKYDFYDLYYKSYATQYGLGHDVPAEGVFLKQNYFKKNGSPRIVNESYKKNTLDSIESLISTLKTKMQSESREDDW
jgi:hypothetical protein